LVALTMGAVAGWVISRPVNGLLGWLFHRFNEGFGGLTRRYTWAVGWLLRGAPIVLFVYAWLVALSYWGFIRTPRGFIPSQDMGYLFVSVQLPDSASIERTEQVMQQVGEIARSTPGVRHATTISGQSFALSASGSNFGSVFVNLADYKDRRT